MELCALGVSAVHGCSEIIVGKGNGVRRGKDEMLSDALNADHH
jgi:hypothetical protein